MAFTGSLVLQLRGYKEKAHKTNQKHASRKKCFNKDTDISGSGPPKSTFQCHQPKLNSFHFNNPYDSINTKYNTNEPTPLVNATDEYLPEEPEVEEEDYFYDAREYATNEEDLNHIHSDINLNFPLPNINSGVLDM